MMKTTVVPKPKTVRRTSDFSIKMSFGSCHEASEFERAMSPATAESLLQDLVQALDSAFISTWQTTSHWAQELERAKTYLKEISSD